MNHDVTLRGAPGTEWQTVCICGWQGRERNTAFMAELDATAHLDPPAEADQ